MTLLVRHRPIPIRVILLVLSTSEGSAVLREGSQPIRFSNSYSTRAFVPCPSPEAPHE